MKNEIKTYLDDLGVSSTGEILEGKLNLIWQRKYKEVQNSDKSLEEKTEILIKINNAKDKLEYYEKDLLRSFLHKESNKVSKTKNDKSQEEKIKKSNKVSKTKNDKSQEEKIKKSNKVIQSKNNQTKEANMQKKNRDDPSNYEEVQLIYRGVSYSKTWNKKLKKFGKFKSFLMKLVS